MFVINDQNINWNHDVINNHTDDLNKSSCIIKEITRTVGNSHGRKTTLTSEK